MHPDADVDADGFVTLTEIDKIYNSTRFPILITENGISSKGNRTDLEPEINDQWRIEFYHGYIGQLQRAIEIDSVNIIGYTGKYTGLIGYKYCTATFIKLGR